MADAVQKQSQELATQLWAIANELRGNMDASKFKNYESDTFWKQNLIGASLGFKIVK